MKLQTLQTLLIACGVSEGMAANLQAEITSEMVKEMQSICADAWDAGMRFGMNDSALKCCVRTTTLNESIEAALKNNPRRF